MQVTAKQFAVQQKVDHIIAYNLLQFLMSKDLARPVGKRPNITGKGKPSIIYEVQDEVTLNFAA